MHEQYNDQVFEANEENILDDALYAYDYINLVLGIEEKNIIVFGRSMGSGPATHVASKRNPATLMLMSSFKSIRDIAKDQAGNLLSYLIQDRFQNIKKIEKVTCPTFLVHGMMDKLIPY
jgi:abhydrolase domain-containing protein 17